MSSGGGGSLLSSSGLSLSGKPGLTPTTTSSYIPSRLDSALSSTYHPPLGTSPMPPMTSSSSVAPGGSLKMFLGQHQPGFPSSSIKVHPRAPGSGSGNGGTGSVGSKMGASDWPDLGVSITSKSSSTQWSNMSNDVSTASSKGRQKECTVYISSINLSLSSPSLQTFPLALTQRLVHHCRRLHLDLQPKPHPPH